MIEVSGDTIVWRIVRKADPAQEPEPVVVVSRLPELPAWAWKPRRKAPGDPTYRAMLEEVASEIAATIDKLIEGELDARQWGDEFFVPVSKGHILSWLLGRQRGGALSALDEFDVEAALSIADAQGEFLLGFIDDLDNGRYTLDDGSINEAAVRARANLYVGAMRGTANEAFVESGGAEELYDWILGLNENHCEDCPLIASRSPYTRDANVGHPGGGETDCLGNCLCVWRRRSDGRTGFAPVRLAA